MWYILNKQTLKNIYISLNDYKKTSNILKEYETLSRNLIFENANFNSEFIYFWENKWKFYLY